MSQDLVNDSARGVAVQWKLPGCAVGCAAANTFPRFCHIGWQSLQFCISQVENLDKCSMLLQQSAACGVP